MILLEKNNINNKKLSEFQLKREQSSINRTFHKVSKQVLLLF